MKKNSEVIGRKNSRAAFIESAAVVPLILIALIIAWFSWVSFGANWTLEMLTPTQKPYKTSPVSIKSSNPNGGKPISQDLQRENEAKPSEDSHLEKLGQSGDSFGGFNALAAAGAFMGAIWAGSLQRRFILENRKDVAYQQAELAVFQMLEIIDRRAEAIIYLSPGVKQTGFAALNAIAANIGRNAANISFQQAVDHYKKSYHLQPSNHGPFWRTLFQTFNLISDEPISDEQKVKLSKIVRGQLPEGAVFLLSLNSQTSIGEPFIKLINEYTLLKYMHEDYKQKFNDELNNRFKPSAFKREYL